LRLIQPFPSALTVATFALLFLAVLGLWWGRKVWPVVCALAIVAGYLSGVLTGLALLWIVMLGVACIFYVRFKSAGPGLKTKLLRTLTAAGILVFSLGLGMHALPGFHNLLVARDLVISPGAEPYTLYLNFDKTMVGILILGIVYQPLIATRRDWLSGLRRSLPLLLGTVAVLIAGSLALGYVRWDPKWHELFWIWAPANLLLTCLSEEAFFRGFLQREIRGLLTNRRHADVVAVGVSAIAFGAAHLGGGPTYALLAGVAGVGYGWVYARTGRIEMAMLTHFALNAVHFLLFTYPRLEV
jgi:uncharacterized protein